MIRWLRQKLCEHRWTKFPAYTASSRPAGEGWVSVTIGNHDYWECEKCRKGTSRDPEKNPA